VHRVAARCERRGIAVTAVARYLVPELTALWRRLVEADAVDQNDAAAIAACDYAVGLQRTLLPALARGRLVLADRYVYSHLVYFGLRGVSTGRLAELFRDPLVPDRVLHLVVRPSEAYARLRATGKPDLWEAALDHRLGFRIGEAARYVRRGRVDAAEVEQSFLEYQAQAVELFHEVLPVPRTVELDGRQPMEGLEELAWLEIDRVLAGRAARVT
jgi:thymidylate kinase